MPLRIGFTLLRVKLMGLIGWDLIVKFELDTFGSHLATLRLASDKFSTYLRKFEVLLSRLSWNFLNSLEFREFVEFRAFFGIS